MVKDLVKELREITDENAGCTCMSTIVGGSCGDFRNCAECASHVANALADRIEAEYDPKPEPDTLEKVAVDMWNYLEYLYRMNFVPLKVHVQAFSERLEDLGVTLDDERE